MKKQTKVLLAAVAAIVVLAAAFFALYLHFTPSSAAGEKQIVLTVVHKDGAQADFTLDTEAEYLGDALLDKNLVKGEESADGLYVTEATAKPPTRQRGMVVPDQRRRNLPPPAYLRPQSPTETASSLLLLRAGNMRTNLRELILYGLLGALLFGVQVALAALPNIELVSTSSSSIPWHWASRPSTRCMCSWGRKSSCTGWGCGR